MKSAPPAMTATSAIEPNRIDDRRPVGGAVGGGFSGGAAPPAWGSPEAVDPAGSGPSVSLAGRADTSNVSGSTGSSGDMVRRTSDETATDEAADGADERYTR